MVSRHEPEARKHNDDEIPEVEAICGTFRRSEGNTLRMQRITYELDWLVSTTSIAALAICEVLITQSPRRPGGPSI